MCRVREDEVSKPFPFFGDVNQTQIPQYAVGICCIKLVFTYIFGLEWMCNASSIEVVSIDVEVTADKLPGLIAELFKSLILAILLDIGYGGFNK